MLGGILYPQGQKRSARLIRRVCGAQTYAFLKGLTLALPWRRNSYSQWGDDSVFLKYLPEKSGSYLDIGASNPVFYSNTYGLYRRGWSGVCVDPISTNVILAGLFRRRDSWIQGLVSDSAEPLDFYEIDPSFYSTTDAQIVECALTGGAVLVRSQTIQPTPVSDLRFKADPHSASFASIDVEGHELAVLNSFDWKLQLPRVILIEFWNREGRSETNQACDLVLAEQGYVLREKIGGDNFLYVHGDWNA